MFEDKVAKAANVEIFAPLSGVIVPIETVPDPVFAQKMVGEGVSIDPVSSQMIAPIAGEVVLIHPANHAVTLRHNSGLEILVHIGLDTVMLKGAGFRPRVSLGDKVEIGTPLIDFDIDEVGSKARSLLTQIVVSNSDMLQDFKVASGMAEAGKTVIFNAVVTEFTESSENGDGTVLSDLVTVKNPTGLHARPAAMLAAEAKKYAAEITLIKGDEEGNAKSVVGVMGMEIGCGDQIHIKASGSDAQAAVEGLIAAIKAGLGEEVPEDEPELPQTTSETVAEVPLNARVSDDPNLLLGVAASPGLGMGVVVQIKTQNIEVTETAGDQGLENQKLDQALARSISQLKELENQLRTEADPDKAAIFAAHQELLADPDLINMAKEKIALGKSAAWAWKESFTSYAIALAGMSNALLAGRATDVKDVGMRVLVEITGEKIERPELPDNAILIAEDLTPSDTASFDRNKVKAFATTMGGASSHVAILARSLDIPAICSVEERALTLAEGSNVIVDGTKGTLRINVSSTEIAEIQARQEAIAAKKKADLAVAHEPAITKDGHRVEVVANIGSADDAREAMAKGAEGVGLLRTEFVFMARNSAPTEDQQYEVYTEIARELKPGQPLVIRTLDVGGDKPLSYLPIPREENPFLGERGIRVGINRPEVLRTQVRALLRSSGAGAKLNVMFPMVATLEDFRLAKGVVEAERQTLGLDPIPVGIMVEVPSVAMMADQFAREVDFFSIGTNDLTQYTMAMDRGHPKLASQIDGLNPAVLALIDRAVVAAHRHGKWVGVCGGLASDPHAIPILIGLGVDELSASIPVVPAVKAQIRELSLVECQDLARKALLADSAAAVRKLVPITEM